MHQLSYRLGAPPLYRGLYERPGFCSGSAGPQPKAQRR